MTSPRTTDLFSELEQLKREKNAIILAHYYQEPDIQDVLLPIESFLREFTSWPRARKF
jgi:quinolinate synthase